MTTFKSGDLVVLKSGGPIMTVDTVNTDIFDDNKMTGLLCVWFVGNKLERVRFDHRAIELADPQAIAAKGNAATDVPGEYTAVLDSMVGALNSLSNEPRARPPRRRRKPATPAALADDTPRLDT
jgi:uncharacterized protein YodC (DUF2158 family)